MRRADIRPPFPVTARPPGVSRALRALRPPILRGGPCAPRAAQRVTPRPLIRPGWAVRSARGSTRDATAADPPGWAVRSARGSTRDATTADPPGWAVRSARGSTRDAPPAICRPRSGRPTWPICRPSPSSSGSALRDLWDKFRGSNAGQRPNPIPAWANGPGSWGIFQGRAEGPVHSEVGRTFRPPPDCRRFPGALPQALIGPRRWRSDRPFHRAFTMRPIVMRANGPTPFQPGPTAQGHGVFSQGGPKARFIPRWGGPSDFLGRCPRL